MTTFFWFSFVFSFISVFGGSSTSTNIECDYGMGYHYIDGEIYRCWVNNNLNIITEESAEISGVSGIHQGSRSNGDVLGFHASYKTMQFFPKGLDKFFKNIKEIGIRQCQLKEIHQSDLKGFPYLVDFELDDNAIEVIEEGLFDFNPDLESVEFFESGIIHIDPNVFDHLNKLSNFFLFSAPCFGEPLIESSGHIQEIINRVKSNCSNSEFLSLDNQIKNLEIDSKTLNSEDFHTKLEIFEKTFNKSKFSKFRPLSYNFENLKLTPGCPDCVKLNKKSTKNINDVNMANSLRGSIIFIVLPLILHFLPIFY